MGNLTVVWLDLTNAYGPVPKKIDRDDNGSLPASRSHQEIVKNYFAAIYFI